MVFTTMSKLKLPAFFIVGAVSLLFSTSLAAQEVVSDSVSQLKIDQRMTIVPVAAKKVDVVANAAVEQASISGAGPIAAPVFVQVSAPVSPSVAAAIINPTPATVSAPIPVTTPVIEQMAPPAVAPAKASVATLVTTPGTTSAATKVVPPITASNFDPSDANADVVGEGDQLLVTVFGQPDLSADIIVGANGIVTLPLVGTVDVRGKTGSEIAGIFAKKLEAGQYLIKPKVSVKVAAQVSRSFSVLGEVVRPGRFILQGNLSVLDALSLAGGVTPRADKNLRILRRSSQEGKAELTEYATVRLDFEDEKITHSSVGKFLPMMC